MEPTEAVFCRVTQDLITLADLFRDSLSETQMDSYWAILQPELSLDEWDYAYRAALKRTTFLRVPLPAVLIAYGLEYRAMASAVEDALHAAERQVQRTTRLLPMRDTSLDMMSRAEVHAIIDRIWPGEILQSMPAPLASESTDEGGKVLYLSGRTPAQEAARKEHLRSQVRLSQEQDGGSGA